MDLMKNRTVYLMESSLTKMKNLPKTSLSKNWEEQLCRTKVLATHRSASEPEGLAVGSHSAAQEALHGNLAGEGHPSVGGGQGVLGILEGMTMGIWTQCLCLMKLDNFGKLSLEEVLRGSIYKWDMGKIKAEKRFKVVWWGPGRGHPEIKYPGLRGFPLGCQYLRLFYRQWLSVVSITMGVQGIFRSKVGQNVVMYQLVWVVKVARQGTRRRLRLATWRSTRCTRGGTTRRTGRSSSPLPRCSTRSPSVVVCLLLEAAYYAMIGQKNGRKAGLHVGLSRGPVDGSC